MIEGNKKRRIIVDTDPNMWVPRREIDDTLALLFLMASPEVEIEGITINFGNVKTPIGYTTARELLDNLALSIPLFRGARSRQDLGKKNEAVEFLVQKVREAPGEISLLSLAPLTNVATASLLDDAFLQNLGGLVVMGGAFRFPFFSFFGEFNFHCDASAAATVLSAPVSKTMITMDLCSQVVFTKRHLDIVKKWDGEMAEYILRFVEPWFAFNKKIFFRKRGFFPWDVVAAASLIDESLFDANPCIFSICEKGLRSGSLTPLSTLAKEGSGEGACTANVPESLCVDRFMDLFLSRLRHHTENSSSR